MTIESWAKIKSHLCHWFSEYRNWSTTIQTDWAKELPNSQEMDYLFSKLSHYEPCTENCKLSLDKQVIQFSLGTKELPEIKPILWDSTNQWNSELYDSEKCLLKYCYQKPKKLLKRHKYNLMNNSTRNIRKNFEIKSY